MWLVFIFLINSSKADILLDYIMSYEPTEATESTKEDSGSGDFSEPEHISMDFPSLDPPKLEVFLDPYSQSDCSCESYNNH